MLWQTHVHFHIDQRNVKKKQEVSSAFGYLQQRVVGVNELTHKETPTIKKGDTPINIPDG